MRLLLARAGLFFVCTILFVPFSALADDAPPPETVTVCTYESLHVECTDVSPDAIPPDSLTESEANFLHDRDVLVQRGEFLRLAASFGETPLVSSESIAVPLATEKNISWTYAENTVNPYRPTFRETPVLANVLNTADLTLELYKGTVGDSTLVFSKTLTATDTPPVAFSFPAAGHYFLVYSATYATDKYPPGLDPAEYCTGGGDICPVYHFSLTDFRNFITHGKALEKNGEHKGSYIPAAFGILEFDVVDTPPSPVVPKASNVLFLPGIEGSRLYRTEDNCSSDDCENKLWEPIISFLGLLTGLGNDKVHDLFLNTNGESVRSDIYTKENDIIDTALTTDYYKSFIGEMNGLKTAGTIGDWKAVSYDWRLSLNDLVTKGREIDGHISYTTATDTPYIEQTLRSLASTSKTGKITIIAHSNGGLVAKALMQKIGIEETALLIDDIIFIGVPQSGAPEAIGSLLYGDQQSIPSPIPYLSVVTRDSARGLAQYSPMAYHLLPSSRYFSDTNSDGRHPVCVFTGTAYAKEEAAYGQVIRNSDQLRRFLLASNEGDTALNERLLSYGEAMHTMLDTWTPPTSVNVYQIAGWGADTIAGVDFYTASGLLGIIPSVSRSYRPLFVEDGDGVVPVPSALMMNSDTGNTKRYWLNLKNINDLLPSEKAITHGNMLEAKPLLQFLENILVTDSTSGVPQNISVTQPPDVSLGKKLVFILHSPLTLELYDAQGNHAGQNENGTFDQNISGARYGEFGETKYLIAPLGPDYTLHLRGLETGTFTLDMEEMTGGVTGAITTIANVPTTAHTTATLHIGNGVETASALEVDEDGDSVNDISLSPQEGTVTTYEAPRQAEPVRPVTVSNGSISIPTSSAPVPTILFESTSTPTTTVQVLPDKIEVQPTRTIVQSNTTSAKFIGAHVLVPSRKVNTSDSASAYAAVQSHSWFSNVIHTLYIHAVSGFARLARLF